MQNNKIPWIFPLLLLSCQADNNASAELPVHVLITETTPELFASDLQEMKLERSG